ncbi:MAG: hypothetical protein OXG04_09160 [Acidobacteria bacterium]|nr:hypothetical protein [Acidobacteriota bacterium]
MSSTELMNQAEHGGSSSNPQLSQAGLLNDARWCSIGCDGSTQNAEASSSLRQ